MIARCSSSVGRPGITLMEVLVSLAIFLFSLAAIGHLISTSAARAVDVQMETRASQLCQSKLAEVVTGVQALDGSDGTFPEDPEWSWAIESNQADLTGLWNVKVTVRKERADNTPIEVSLSQMVLEPSYRGSSFDTPPAASSTDTGSSATNSGSTAPPASGGATSKPATPTGGATSKPTTPSGGGASKPTMTGGGTTRPASGTGTTPTSGGSTRPTTGGTTTPTSGTPAPRSGSGTPARNP